MKNVRRYLKGSLVAKAIPHDAELKAHLTRQMDELYGPEEAELDRMEAEHGYHGPFPPDHCGPKATQAILENIISAEVDMVNLPPHYAKLKIEPMRYAVENNFDIFQFSITKYLARWRDKGAPKQDLRKARRVMDMYIKFEDGDPDWWKADPVVKA